MDDTKKTSTNAAAVRKDRFPPMINTNFLKACRGEPVERIPVWIMRQAGRYLPEFQELRAQYDFFTVCETPELACEVTLMPIKRFDLDAAIIFSDILVIPKALGLEVRMLPGIGPDIVPPFRTPEDFSRLDLNNPVGKLGYVGEAITLTRMALQGKCPLLGFAGGPWTLMSYMIEGRGTKVMTEARRWLYQHPEESKRLLTILSDVIIDFLLLQIEAGAQALQIFESNVELLNIDLFNTYCAPYLKHIAQEVRKKKKNDEQVPLILFAKGGHFCLKAQSNLGYDVISVDWTVDPNLARFLVGDDITLQGNMDPAALFAPPDVIANTARSIAQKFGRDRYIANLGHGIYPESPIESVESFITSVHKSV